MDSIEYPEVLPETCDRCQSRLVLLKFKRGCLPPHIGQGTREFRGCITCDAEIMDYASGGGGSNNVRSAAPPPSNPTAQQRRQPAQGGGVRGGPDARGTIGAQQRGGGRPSLVAGPIMATRPPPARYASVPPQPSSRQDAEESFEDLDNIDWAEMDALAQGTACV